MRRLVWMAAGAAITAAGKRWTVRRATRIADRYAPAAVARRTVGGVGKRVDAAWREGRAAMTETEDRLRARFRQGGG